MKAKAFLIISLLGILVLGCSKSDNGSNPPPPTPEDWTFPSDTTTNSIKVFSEKSSVAVGEAFDVKVILYNVTGIFGAAAEIAYTSANATVSSVLAGPFFTPDANILTVSNINAGRNIASFGVTYRAGSNGLVTGSGVVFKLKCVGTAAGTATFAINPTTLEVRKTDNTIHNPSIRPALSVTVH
jgi:hypothetical protein